MSQVLDAAVETGRTSAFSGRNGRNAVALSLSAKIAVVFLNAGTGVLTARLLLPAGRGELAALLLWPLVLSGAVTLGLPSALTFFMRSHPERSNRYKSTAILMAFAVGFAVSAAAVIAAPALLRQYDPHVVRLAQWLMPNTMVALLLLVGRGALEATGDFRHSSSALLIPPTLTLTSLALLGAAGLLTPERAALVYILSGLPAFAFLWKRLSFSVFDSWRAHYGTARELLSYGLRSYGIDLCGTLAIYIDQALVVTLLAPAQMGLYVVALSVSRLINVLPQALGGVLFPKLVGLSSDIVVSTVGRALRLVLLISGAGLLLVAACGPAAVRLLYGPRYSGLLSILYILVIEAAISGLVTLASQAFMACNRPGVVTIQQLAGLLTAFPLLISLIPRFGVSGAALGLLLSTVIRFLLIFASFPLVLKRSVPRLLITKADCFWASHAFNLRRILPIRASR